MRHHLHLLSPRGFRGAAAHAGLKSTSQPDVGLLVCDAPQPATAAAMFTTNRVVAAPIAIGREHLRSSGGRLRAIVVNSGNANACTGKRGERDAQTMCTLAASQIGTARQLILPCSTGVIGYSMPMTKLKRGIIAASKLLGSSSRHAGHFADAILTTDTRRKSAAARVRIGRETAVIAGVCKGSGMIGPRLGPPHATMLAFLTTDAMVSAPALRKLLQPAVNRTFNAVTVDDHTSTNDTVAILASGLSGARINTISAAKNFFAALTDVCRSLAYQIAADGEGATKVVRIEVTGARHDRDAQLIARAIANSPLVKCAMHGNDPNWGRIISAAGYCGAAFDPAHATLTLQRTRVFARGRPLPFGSARLSRALKARDVEVVLSCGLGAGSASVWTCDLSKDYVTINADYHT